MMANFQVKTKNQREIHQKPRVYLTCHPEDQEHYLEKICADIFKTHDCAVYYTEDMARVLSEQERETDLGRCNLVVIPVTHRLLTTSNRAMDEDLPYALKARIPVLPIMMEPGLDEIYARADKFGELQYLNPCSADQTEIAYGEKLKKHLEAVLFSDELARRVRADFAGHIFLSYRKKDRQYANELMRMIHSVPGYRDVAIWFDEFLTPGESFRENIENRLAECRLFALLVTPRLLEKVTDGEGVSRENYVIATELPLAREKKMEILAVEMEQTDRDALRAAGITRCVKAGESRFREMLAEALPRIGTAKQARPDHDFLMGMAYLDGIDAEVDRENGLKLITQAAEDGWPEAMAKLYDLYTNGIGVEVDYQQALAWAERMAGACESLFGEEDPATLRAVSNLAQSYCRIGDYRKGLELQERSYTLSAKILGENHIETLQALSNLATICSNLGDDRKALEYNERAYDRLCKTLGDEHPETLASLHNLAAIYAKLGDDRKALALADKVYGLRCKILGKEDPATLSALEHLAVIYGNFGDYRAALNCHGNILTSRGRILGPEHPDTVQSMHNLAYTQYLLGEYGKAVDGFTRVYELFSKLLGPEHPHTLNTMTNLAATYAGLGEHRKALELEERVYRLHCRDLGEEHPATLLSLGNLAVLYSQVGDHEKTLELEERAYRLHCRVLGEEHPDTLTVLNNLAGTYQELGDHGKALQLLEKVYNARCRILGQDYPETLETLNDLAVTFYHMGDYRKAIDLFGAVFTLRNKVLGQTHPKTLQALTNIAVSFQTAGVLKTTLQLLEMLHARQVAAFGKDHPKTRETVEWMTRVRAKISRMS